jgi:general secretion pathway protein K
MAGHAHPLARFLTIGSRPRTTSRPPLAQRGIALLLVLWVLVLLTIIAVGLTAAQRTESALASNQLATARFHAAAEAGINWAMLNLLAPPTVFDEDADTWVPDGTSRLWTFAGETLEIRVFNETSRIDLNEAQRDQLEALLKAAGLDDDRASAVADAIEDWRDTDDLTGLNGAEDADYENAGRTYGAKDGPFDTVEELQQVLGVDPELYRMLAPALTVDSDQATPTQEFAPPLVQAALQGITLEEWELEKHEQDSVAEPNDSGVSPVGRGGPLYRIRVTRLLDDGPGMSMDALVRVEASRAQPFNILWRRFGIVDERPGATAQETREDAGLF